MFGFLDPKHETVSAISVEVFPGVLRTEQKHIGNWREAIEMGTNKIRQKETYRRPSGAWYLVGATMAPICRNRCPVHGAIVHSAFLVPKCANIC